MNDPTRDNFKNNANVARISDVLANSFDFPFQVWSPTEIEGQLRDFGIPSSRQVAYDGPFTIRTHDEQHLLLIPFDDSQCQPCFAASLIQTNEPDRYIQMARFCMEMDSQSGPSNN